MADATAMQAPGGEPAGDDAPAITVTVTGYAGGRYSVAADGAPPQDVDSPEAAAGAVFKLLQAKPPGGQSADDQFSGGVDAAQGGGSALMA